MWTMTSPASTRTQSQWGRPSIFRSALPPAFSFSTSWSAIAATCRFDRPLAITIWSASAALPSRSRATTCSALASSRLSRIETRRGGGGIPIGKAFAAAAILRAPLRFICAGRVFILEEKSSRGGRFADPGYLLASYHQSSAQLRLELLSDSCKLGSCAPPIEHPDATVRQRFHPE